MFYGYEDGDRVRDTRTGRLGTVRFREQDAEEVAAGEVPPVIAEIVWAGLFVRGEVDEFTVPYLERAE